MEVNVQAKFYQFISLKASSSIIRGQIQYKNSTVVEFKGVIAPVYLIADHRNMLTAFLFGKENTREWLILKMLCAGYCSDRTAIID